LFGLPGAAVFRFANTADAMWGYRGRFEWAGKWAARADDVLSWLPARLTGLMFYPPSNAAAWKALFAQARKTPSPNGGWPMGAMALRLGVRLRKPGVYALNEAAPSPGNLELGQALRCAGRCAGAAVVAATALWGWRAA
jgi:adenosylcobinamide-phosphate synthase